MEKVKKYHSAIKKSCKKAPNIFFIENIQWLDNHSLKLLRALIENESSMWGMLILEENDTMDKNPEVCKFLSTMESSGKIKKLPIRRMQKGFEAKLLEQKFEPGFFTQTEYEYIYTHSKGNPGELTKKINEWEERKWIYRDNGKWYKCDDFADKIKPPEKLILDLIITLAEDNIISDKEKKLITKIASALDFPKEEIFDIADIVIECKKIGYEIEGESHLSFLSKYAFFAVDNDRTPYIVEYIKYDDKHPPDISPLEITHPRLLPIEKVVLAEKGIFIISKYYEGKTLKQIVGETQDTIIVKSINIAVDVAEGLRQLHKENRIHGPIRPESILLSSSGEVKIISLDAPISSLRNSFSDGDGNILQYASPEFLKGESIDQRSDIFSFGILLYEMIAGVNPFYAETPKQITYSILHSNPDINILKSRLASYSNAEKLINIIETCLHKFPENRYQSMDEVIAELKSLKLTKIDESQIRSTATDEKLEIDKQEREEATKKPKHILLRPYILYPAIALIVLSVFFAKKIWPGPDFIANEVAINKVVVNSDNEDASVFKDMLIYLIKDEIMQSFRKPIRTIDEFRIIYPENAPEYLVDLEIKPRGIGYDIAIRTTHYTIDGSGKSKKENRTPLEINLTNVSQLITNNIPLQIARYVLNTDPIQEQSNFTRSWRAFENFFYGELAWDKLEVTNAKTYFQLALDYDSTFVLAKLRLARVYEFSGSQLEARQLIESVSQNLAGLSEVDSLKAEALKARLNGNLLQAIDIQTNIYSILPTTKDAIYNLAEAYYQICNIDNAIHYYEEALKYFPNFSLAYNHLGYCYMHKGEHEKSLKCFRKYIELDQTANAYDSWGDGLMAAGKLDSAAYAKEMGIKISPDIGYLYQSLCFINIHRGRFADAKENAENYLSMQSQRDNIANGYYLNALIKYYENQLDSSLYYCNVALDQFDSMDITTRNHNLHWLKSLIHLERNEIYLASQELIMMENIISSNNISFENYYMNLLKYYYLLKAYLAAKDDNFNEFNSIIALFDGILKDKVKDHTSPFDLAYTNTMLAKIIMEEFPENRLTYAEERLRKAMEYNKSYPFAHYYMWKLYEMQGKNDLANKEKNIFASLWSNADEEAKTLYGIQSDS